MENLDFIIEESSLLLKQIQQTKALVKLNENNAFFSKLGKLVISAHVLPFLEIKEVLSMRLVSRQFVSSVDNAVTMTALLKRCEKPAQELVLKPVDEVTDIDDLKNQIECLKKSKSFLTNKVKELELFHGLMKEDIENLKLKLKTQKEINEKLEETSMMQRHDLNQLKSVNFRFKHENEVLLSEKEEQETTRINEKDALIRQLEDLRNKKNEAEYKSMTVKRELDELKSKNLEKTEALKALREFFLKTISDKKQ